MSDLQTCSIRDNFLIKLNICRNEFNTKFKQISDNLLIRQNQILTELDEIENNYSESRNVENLLKPTEKYRNDQIKGLQGSFLPENIISHIKLTIQSLDAQIAKLRQKLVTFTNIDIELDTDNINTLIDKLGSVILTEDSEYNSCVEYITDTCHIDPLESYNPFNNNNNNNTIVCTPIEDVASIPESGIPDSQSPSYKQSMVQYNTPFNLNKNECPVDSSPGRPVVYRTKSSSILPGTTTNVLTVSQVKANHKSSEVTVPNQYVNDSMLGSFTGNAAILARKIIQRENKMIEDLDLETSGKCDMYQLFPTLPQGTSTKSDLIGAQDCYKIGDIELNNSASISPTAYKYSPQPSSENSFEKSDFEHVRFESHSKASERSAGASSLTDSTTSSINDSLSCSNEDNLNQVRNSSPSISSNDEDLTLLDTKTDATIKPEEETNILGGIIRKDKKKKNRKNKIPFKWPKGTFM